MGLSERYCWVGRGGRWLGGPGEGRTRAFGLTRAGVSGGVRAVARGAEVPSLCWGQKGVVDPSNLWPLYWSHKGTP